MNRFKVGDRVVAYTHLGSAKGFVKLIDRSDTDFMYVESPKVTGSYAGSREVYVHYKQCRRLVQKGGKK